MSKRTKDLDPTTTKVNKFVALDGASQAEAEKFDMNNILATTDIRVGSASLSASASPQQILFTDIGTTSYLVFAYVRDSEGTVSFLLSNYLTDRFSVQVAYAATIDYIIFKTA